MTADILCLTGCDDRFGPLGDISLRSLRHYCQWHDIRLTFQPLTPATRPISWSKIPLIQEAFRAGAEFVWWVDADALVVDPSRSIRDVIEPGKDLYLVRHDDGRRCYPNAGVMLLRNTPWMVDVLQQIWNMEEYIDHKWWETAALTHMLSPESFAEVRIPDDRQRIDDTPVKWLGQEWNSVPFVKDGRFASSHPVIVHYASLPLKYRLAAIRRDFRRSPAGREEAANAPTRFQTWRRLRPGRLKGFGEGDVSKVAFVLPWLPESTPGGAETLALTTAQHLRQAGMDTEILTTCIRDIFDDYGHNYHNPGTVYRDGLPVRRFAVKKRKARPYHRLNRRLMDGETITPKEERLFIDRMIVAPSLYRYLESHRQQCLYIFLPYMFSTTYFGVRAVPDRSLVIPCLHDESYARMGIYHDMLRSAKGLLFNTEAEEALATSLIGKGNGQIRRVIGSGIDTEVRGDGARFRSTHLVDGPMVLYAGRDGEGKNVPLLLAYWKRYIEESARAATLVRIGSHESSCAGDDDPTVRNLGFVSAQEKYDALAAADVLCQPSLNESFSLVIMESWVQETPVLVHGDCAVTHQHVTRSGGGLAFTDYDEFAAALTHLFDAPEDARRMGQRGRQYVLDNYQWSAVVAQYQDVIAEASATR